MRPRPPNDTLDYRLAMTRIAFLATVSDLHTQPIRYDLAELSRIVSVVQPELFGVEVEQDDFERGDLAEAPIEVRDALVPLAGRTDIVLVPLGAALGNEPRAPGRGFRAATIRVLDRTLTGIQKLANGARAVNSQMVCHACGLICRLEALISGKRGRAAWEDANQRMLRNIDSMTRRDPGARMLVAVQCRRKHWLESRLKRLAEVEVVRYWEL